MEVNHKLLEKYYKNNCTLIEQKSLEEWLSSDKFDDNKLQLPIVEKKILHKRKMWKKIYNHVNNSTSSVVWFRKKTTYYTSIAASVLVFISFSVVNFFNQSLLGTEIAYNNTENCNKQIQTAGMSFTLTPNSKIDVVTNLYQKKSNIAFCGTLKIKNKTQSKIKTAFTSSCDLEREVEISLSKNKTYYVFTMKNKKEDKFYVLNKDQIIRLPKNQAIKALSLTKKI